MSSRDFRYHLLSIGVTRPPEGARGGAPRDPAAAVRAAERDAFGISWTFAQLGYWRAERNRCVTGAHATPASIDAHLGFCADLADLDLLFIYWSGHLCSVDAIVASMAGARDARLRILIVDTCPPGDRLRQLEDGLSQLPDGTRPVAFVSCAPDGRARENSVHGFFTAALLRQLRRPRRPGTRSLDLLDAFNRTADETAASLGHEPLFTATGAGRLRIRLPDLTFG